MKAFVLKLSSLRDDRTSEGGKEGKGKKGGREGGQTYLLHVQEDIAICDLASLLLGGTAPL